MFGVHDCKVRTRTMYWPLIESLANENTVYLTDTFKLFFRDSESLNLDKSRSYNQRKFTNPEQDGHADIHQATFREEVEMVNPGLIVTIGTHPRLWFTSDKAPSRYDKLLERSTTGDKLLYYNNIPVLPLMHLSGRTANTAFRTYNVQDRTALIDLYKRLIEERLRIHDRP